ncbi:MAG TPA: Hsp33 family molecular chaperone HslO [Bacteriovoracaceae bacterium]|nr:Hsp33 family molecular chaperone HslO [Bacteriovoracaceae bacterium]
MLATSRLYSFLDHHNGFSVHFFEGQKLIHDLALMHPLQGSGFAYFRDTLLGIIPIIFFLKPGESLGVYVDSNEPYFRLKIETNSAGHTRTLLLPLEFNLFPMKITGQVRVTKIFPGNKSPYTSVLELHNVETKDVINQILNESYQTNSEVIIAEVSDQAVMVTKLPQLNTNKVTDDSVSRKEFIRKNKQFFHDVFEAASDDIETIVKMFEDHNLSYLGSRQVAFFCPCSKDRMVLNLRGLYAGDIDHLFEGKDTVEVVCDYCMKKYDISKGDVLGS